MRTQQLFERNPFSIANSLFDVLGYTPLSVNAYLFACERDSQTTY